MQVQAGTTGNREDKRLLKKKDNPQIRIKGKFKQGSAKVMQGEYVRD